MIELKNVVKSFGSFNALDGVDMLVPTGSVYGLVGPNGAGKTTLMNTLCGIYKAKSGEILVDGQSVFENNEVKKKIVYISDDVFHFHNSTTDSLKDFYKEIYPAFDEKMFIEYAKYFPSINPMLSIRRLSKGMKKQVAFWIAMCCKPDILVLDEPVDGLDPMMRHQVWGLIMNELSLREMTVLISSHNLRELEDVCDMVGIMNRGKIFLQSSLDELKAKLMKIQVSFEGEIDISSLGIELLSVRQTGRVFELIVRGDKNEVERKLSSSKPLFVQELPLTLEEIFIYELGEADDEVKRMLV